MSWLDWFKRRATGPEVEEEIRSSLAMAAKDRVAEGEDAKTAQVAARKEFGNVTLAVEAAQSVWRPSWIDTLHDLAQDLRYALRLLRKSPGFSLIVIAVLALGIGLNAAVFTLFKSLALKPLAGVADSGSLNVVLALTNISRQVPLSYRDFQYLREHGSPFFRVSGSTLSPVNLGLGRAAAHRCQFAPCDAGASVARREPTR